MNGKGSARRPTDEKAYAENWERVFGKKKTKQSNDHACLDCAYDENQNHEEAVKK